VVLFDSIVTISIVQGYKHPGAGIVVRCDWHGTCARRGTPTAFFVTADSKGDEVACFDTDL